MAAFSVFVVGLTGTALAAVTVVDTTLDEMTSYLISDADVGDFTVTISGHTQKTQHEARYYFRTESTSSAIDETWLISITGLDPGEVITDFNINTTRIVPTVGGGSGWDWDIDLTAPLNTGGTYMDSRNLTSDVALDPDITFDDGVIGDNFGVNPTFTVNVSKTNSVTRSLGWYDFTIGAALATNVSVPGDTNGNGTVGPEDLTPILQNYRTAQTERTAGDLIDNDFIDYADFREWKTRFLEAGGSLAGIDFNPVAVPEPSSIVIGGLALAGMAVLSRRKLK
ncbi:PEP-CTERM sorting domain-containing protein [Aeoliella sp.]|uniref:PEP-CTERM sorting domain-containing protein n=1 Tax=Aeoliella sp. TaxID=2795800 RepID=UPI003CCC1598